NERIVREYGSLETSGNRHGFRLITSNGPQLGSAAGCPGKRADERDFPADLAAWALSYLFGAGFVAVVEQPHGPHRVISARSKCGNDQPFQRAGRELHRKLLRLALAIDVRRYFHHADERWAVVLDLAGDGKPARLADDLIVADENVELY